MAASDMVSDEPEPGPRKVFNHEQEVIDRGTGLESGLEQDWVPESIQETAL